MRRTAAAVLLLAALAACVRPTTPKTEGEPPPPEEQPAPPSGTTTSTRTPPVYVVLFTHIEDNTPMTVDDYVPLRRRVVDMATLARDARLTWVFQPDWRFLNAVRDWDTEDRMRTTGGVNVLRYIRDTLGAVIDPHSHEQEGYNYADVAYLLQELGVGGSTIVGGHIWQPGDEFQNWPRFWEPLAALRTPEFTWQATALMGAKDLVISGVWQPKDEDNFTTHDTAHSLASVGSFRGEIGDVAELRAAYASDAVDKTCILTTAYHIKPNDLLDLAAVQRHVLGPLRLDVDAGRAVVTNFTAVVETWRSTFREKGCPWIPEAR